MINRTSVTKLFGMLTVSLVVFLIGPIAAEAQDISSSVELLRSDIKTKKVELLTRALALSEQESKVFWPIYREYDVELNKVHDQRVELIRKFGENYQTMTDKTAGELAAKWFEFQQSRAALLRKYHQRVEKELTATRAAQFLQVEHFISLLIDLQISANLPLVEKMKQ